MSEITKEEESKVHYIFEYINDNKRDAKNGFI